MPDEHNPTPFQAVGNRLLELRRAEGLSQGEIAKVAGVSQKSWSNYESGSRELPASALFRLASKFSVDPIWIHEGIGAHPSNRTRGGPSAIWREALLMVERYQEKEKIELSPDRKVKVVETLVAHIMNGGDSEPNFLGHLVELAVGQNA